MSQFLHRPLTRSLLADIADALADIVVAQQGSLPTFLNEIALAQLDRREDVPGWQSNAWLIRDDDSTDVDEGITPQTLFHWFYRRARSYPRELAEWDSEGQREIRSQDPRELSGRRDMARFHDAMVEYGHRMQKTIGPHGSLLPGLLLLGTMGARPHSTNVPEDHEYHSCAPCIREGLSCSTFRDNNGALNLNGSCIHCYIRSSRCPFGKLFPACPSQ